MKAKKSIYIKFRDLPHDFMEETGYTLADFSVALGGFEKANPKIPRFWGSGVLVQKGKRFGILTAHHCVHKPAYDFRFGFGGDKLVLVLKRAQFIVLPPEILIKHALGIPKGNEMEPDLAYIEANNEYEGNNDLPGSFGGVSGGPVWGLQINRNKTDGKLILKKFSLMGIAFLQIEITKKQRRVRAHFIKSIYDLAWRNLK
jgi:hypothetical protein